MVSELSFLLDFFLQPELPDSLKKVVAERMKEIEASRVQPAQPSQITVPLMRPSRPAPTDQAPSILAKYPDLAHSSPMEPIAVSMPVPIEAIAQTPETAKAMIERQAIINSALSGKSELGRTSPRKIGRQ